jgi:hypothetical protein
MYLCIYVECTCIHNQSDIQDHVCIYEFGHTWGIVFAITVNQIFRITYICIYVCMRLHILEKVFQCTYTRMCGDLRRTGVRMIASWYCSKALKALAPDCLCMRMYVYICMYECIFMESTYLFSSQFCLQIQHIPESMHQRRTYLSASGIFAGLTVRKLNSFICHLKLLRWLAGQIQKTHACVWFL